MNHNMFFLWFENQLLKNLEGPSVLIMDNAPYHSTLVEKIPTIASTKAVIKEWLSKLFQMVTRNKPEKRYTVDLMAEQYGDMVLRLPPYHCIFNPIESTAHVAKNYYNRYAGRERYSINNCLDMWKEALSTINRKQLINVGIVFQRDCKLTVY
ncbi:uncharacterized protein LOC143201434 [Rhynchophorus ferrugineus]|uniref:uncharacterized protein LOC143201434 n=1 Tax=Rhynchophorus ferrugineus TaxID=354439 RepID=UPI003FCECD49